MDRETASAAALWKKAESAPKSIRWWELCQPPLRRHSQPERDTVLQAGTLGHRPSEANMALSWHRPWLFWRVLWLGVLLTLLCAMLVYGCKGLLGLGTDAAEKMLLLLPSVTVPGALMIFFWELNVPKNISLWEMLGFFLAGSMLSLLFCMVLHPLIPGTGPWAALREEPAKLAACVLILLYCIKVRKKRIYGFTGLAIGGAVGSGFGVFETISYAMSHDFQTVLLRSALSVAGHTLYVVSFCGALTLHGEGKLSWKSFANRDFGLSFGCALACHGFWNLVRVPLPLRFGVTAVLLWWNALYIVQKCFAQAARFREKPMAEAGGPAGSRLELRCLRGPSAGKCRSFPEETLVTLGRGSRNTLCLPEHTGGISRYHCRLFLANGQWHVQDLNATYGTFVQMPGEPMEKLTAMEPYPVKPGMLLYLGGRKNCFSITLY